jgi:hypothetical protein
MVKFLDFVVEQLFFKTSSVSQATVFAYTVNFFGMTKNPNAYTTRIFVEFFILNFLTFLIGSLVIRYLSKENAKKNIEKV